MPRYEIRYIDGEGHEQITYIGFSDKKSRMNKVKKFSKKLMKEQDIEDPRLVDFELMTLCQQDFAGEKDTLRQLGEQYMDFVGRMVKGEEEKEDDVKITYDLENLKQIKRLSKREKKDIKALKKFAKRSERAGIADYIKPKGRIKALLEKITQGKLIAGNERADSERNSELFQEEAPELSLEAKQEKTIQLLNELAMEEGFDVNTFIQQQEAERGEPLSLDEKNKIIQVYQKTNDSDIRKRVKVKVKPVERRTDSAGKGAEREEESK